MDKYFESIGNFNPDATNMTNAVMDEKTIKMIDSIPKKTTITDDQDLKHDGDIPKYLAPKTIEVKRYILKK